MTMAARVIPPSDTPRECYNADGTPKAAYSTREKARRIARDQRRREGRLVDEYRCSRCDRWHVGHRQGRPEPVRVVRVQMQRRRGWRLPEGAIYVGRPSVWGNGFRIGDPNPTAVGPSGPMSQHTAVALFARMVEPMPAGRRDAWLTPLRDAIALACWCGTDEECHADVLIEWLAR